MVRSIFTLAVAVTFWAFSTAAPIPMGAGPPPLNFPTQVGTKWVYQLPAENVSVVLTDSVKTDSRTVVVSEYTERDGRRCTWEKVAVSDDGIWLVADSVSIYKPPIRWIKATAKQEEKWMIDSAYKFGEDTEGYFQRVGTITFIGMEKVKVPAGVFYARRMEARGGRVWTETRWYAPGVGLVKWIRNNGDTILLKSFALGKE